MKLSSHYFCTVISAFLLSSLVCPVYAGRASVINVDLQAVPSASLSPFVTADGWDIKLAGAILPPAFAKKSPNTTSHYDRNEESSGSVSMVGLAFVQKVCQRQQALFDGQSPASVTLAAGMGGAGGGDDGDDYSHIEKFEREPQAEFFAWGPDSFTQLCLKQKQRLLKILRQKMQWAQACGNSDLALILRDRIMLIEIDRDFLKQQILCSNSSYQTQRYEWLLRDSQEVQHYDQAVNGGDCRPPGYSGRQAGSGGSGASGSGATSKPGGETGIGTRQSGADYHYTSHAPSHALSSHTGDERDDDPPPTKKARSEPVDPIACSRCQKTLNEQEVTRVLQGSTAEPVICDDCLHSASQTLPQETSGKRKATRKRARSDQAAPEPKRSRKRTEKKKQSSNRQGRPAAKRVRLENPELGAQSTPDTVEELEVLQRHLAFEMNDKESEATKQLFEHVKSKNIKIKKSLYTLLAKVNRENLPTFCAKAAIFFGSLTASIKNTGCLTSMLGYRKKHIRDFIEREDNELAYLAGLDTLRALSSMNNGKGLPNQATVKAMLDWALWKVDGQFSMELFRALSSMNNGKGLPDEATVKAMLDWAVWKVDGQFSMELFRALSSMNNGKGLPDEATVKAMLDWAVWKVDGQFSMELFRALSSMNSSRGLPDEAKVKAMLDWTVWTVDGQFSMELFRALSSMHSSRSLPDEATVKAILDWAVWKVDGQLSMELFRALSSMHRSRGLPDEAKVKAMLDWAVWKVDGQFSMERFRALSSMTHGKGLPDEATVKAMLDWLSCGGKLNDSLQKLMIRLYASEGVPDIKELKQYEQKLRNVFFADVVTGLENDDEDEQPYLIKQAALFLSTRKPRYALNFKDVEYFYQQVTGDASRKLEKLLKLLISYGGPGVTRYLALNEHDRNILLSTCALRIPLPLAMQAINDFTPQERKQYLFFSRNLKAPPDKDQWNDLSLQLGRLDSVLKSRHTQRLYLEVIWSLAPSDRDIFLDETSTASVIEVFPSLHALKKLANKHSRQWLKELLETCLQLRQETSSRENIKRLFTALLETQLPLYGHGDIPDYFMSGYMAIENSATFIPLTPPVKTPEELALHFVASVMRVLSDMLYRYEANRLKVEQYGGEINPFPVPELKIHDEGIEISNWPVEVFQRFLAVTELPEHYYLSEDAWQQHCNPSQPRYFQHRMEACHQRERATPDANTFQPLSIPLLMGLLKHNTHITSAAWKSFDHHKDWLPKAAYDWLLHKIEQAPHEDIPVSLREYLEARRPLEEEALPQNEIDAPTSAPPFTVMETMSEEEQFQRLWADLSRKELLVVGDLELLAGYKDYMTMENIVNILKRTDAGMESCKLDELRQLLGEKRDQYSRQDPLLFGLTDEVADYLIEADI